METSNWPYTDADRNDPLTELRIPVLHCPFPEHPYEVALVITNDAVWGPALRPDGLEVAQIICYTSFRLSCYTADHQAMMRQQPLDTATGTNTMVLCKRAPGDWCYRMASWAQGPIFWPWPVPPQTARSLEMLFGRIGDLGGPVSWQDWKAAYPDVFPGNA